MKTPASTPPAPLHRLLVASLTLLLSSGSSVLAAGIVEPFAYPNGNLTTVSGGAWKFWEPGAGDASVVNGAMRFTGTTDVIRTFPAVLTAPGQIATISFSINVNIADSTEAFAMDFLPASAPFGDPNTNYRNQFSLGFDYQSRDDQGNPLPRDGKASIDIATGTGSGTSVTRLGSIMSQNVNHLIRVDLARGAANTAYQLFMDDALIHSGTFVLTDARGMNAVELEQSGEQTPDPSAFATVDNLVVENVPEPGTAVMLSAASVVALSLRRRRRA